MERLLGRSVDDADDAALAGCLQQAEEGPLEAVLVSRGPGSPRAISAGGGDAWASHCLRVQLDHLLVVVRALQQLDPRVERPTLSGEEDLPGRKRAVVAQAAEQAPAASPLPPRGCTLSTNSVAPFSSRPPSEQAACTLSTLARTGKVRTLLPCTLTAEQMQSEEGGAEAAAATQAEKGYLQTQRERCRGRGRRGAGAVEGVCSGDAYSIGPRLRTPSELGPRGVSIVARKGRSRASSAYTRTCEGARRFRAWGCAFM